MLVALSTAACSNSSDLQAIRATQALVPDVSEILETVKNTEGLAIESGAYFVKLQITDGGRGAPNWPMHWPQRRRRKARAITDRESSDGVMLALRGGSYAATVYVLLEQRRVSQVCLRGASY